jgi:TRAP-type C4-dicarboxylate transport system permease small subunit
MGTWEKYVGRIGNWGAALAGVLLVAITLLVAAMVVGRAIHISMPGTFDLVGVTAIVVVSFTIVFGQLSDSHLRADIAVERITGKLRYAIEIFSACSSIFYWAVILVASALQMWTKWRAGETTDILDVPIAPFRVVCVFSLVLMVILLIFKLIHQVKSLVKGEEGK